MKGELRDIDEENDNFQEILSLSNKFASAEGKETVLSKSTVGLISFSPRKLNNLSTTISTPPLLNRSVSLSPRLQLLLLLLLLGHSAVLLLLLRSDGL